MNIPIWIKSAYVTYIGNPPLSFVWRVSPSAIGGKAAWLFGFPCRYYSMGFYEAQYPYFQSIIFERQKHLPKQVPKLFLTLPFIPYAIALL